MYQPSGLGCARIAKYEVSYKCARLQRYLNVRFCRIIEVFLVEKERCTRFTEQVHNDPIAAYVSNKSCESLTSELSLTLYRLSTSRAVEVEISRANAETSLLDMLRSRKSRLRPARRISSAVLNRRSAINTGYQHRLP